VLVDPHSNRRRRTKLLSTCAHLKSYPHHHGPLDVVGLGEGRPPAAETDVPDNGMDPMVTIVPVHCNACSHAVCLASLSSLSVVIDRNRAAGTTGAESRALPPLHTLHPPPPLLLLLPLLLPVLSSPTLPPSLQSLPPLARVPLPSATSTSCRCCALEATER
jgi:hypothetical protein